MENWTGNTGVDTFTLGHNVTGTVSGGAGNDVINYNTGTIGTLTGGTDTDTINGPKRPTPGRPRRPMRAR